MQRNRGKQQNGKHYRSLQENQRYQGKISCKDGHNKGQKPKGRDLTEAEDIKKRWQEYTEELYKKDLHDPDNHDDVITNLEPDILECEVKWALESIIMNQASGGDGIPVELFQILKDDAVKVLHSICQQMWKTQQWPQDWQRSVFIPVPKKGNAKECSNYRTVALISHASGGSEVKASAWNAGDLSSIPGSGRPPGEGDGNPHPSSCLENPMEGRSLVGYSPWGRKESDTTKRLHFHFHRLVK